MSWMKTKYTGVRFREHPTRVQRNGQPDRYFTIRCRIDGELTEERLGWATEGWTAEKAHKVRSELKKSITTGAGPLSLADMRKEAAAEREAAREAEEREKITYILFGDFLDVYYMPVAKREKRSWKTDEQRIAKEIKETLGFVPLRAMTKEHVQAFVDGLDAAGYAPATVKQYMGIVRRAYFIAAATVVNGVTLFTGQNPATENLIRLPAIHNNRERFFLKGEMDKIEELVIKRRDAGIDSPDMLDAVRLSLNTGLRLNELARADWLDVNLVSGIFSVPEEEKRKTGGKVPINKAAAEVLKRRRRASPSGGKVGPVFPYESGPVAWQQHMSKTFRVIIDELELNKGIDPTDRRRRAVFHTLRHTFASWMAIAGTDLYRIMRLMRHKDIKMTMIYAHLIPDATKDAVHKLKPPKGS